MCFECAERSKYLGISAGLQPSNSHLERWRRNLIQLCFQWLACFCCEYWTCEGPVSLIPYLYHISVVDSGEQSVDSWCSGHGHGCRKAFGSQAQWDLDPAPVTTAAWPFRRCIVCIRDSNLAEPTRFPNSEFFLLQGDARSVVSELEAAVNAVALLFLAFGLQVKQGLLWTSMVFKSL